MIEPVSMPTVSTSSPVDLVIIGAGLAGSCLAMVAARGGHTVTLIDTHAVMPPEFRAEKLGAMHMDLFDDLGLGDIVRASVTLMNEARVYRFGRLVSQTRVREYGFAYAELVNALRKALPATVGFAVGRVTDIATGPDRQRVSLADGRTVEGRLLVVATGLGDAVRRQVGITRIEQARGHSLSLGFTLAKPATDYAFENLTYYAARQPSPVAYLTLFRLGETIRANLFLYRAASDPWIKQLIADPSGVLSALMPEIAPLSGGFAVVDKIKVRPIDLTLADNYRRPGVVLVGDAFCTTCPVPGVGIRRVMTDVDRLGRHWLPQWLATEGMGLDKISAYYDDPAKQTMDAQAMRSSVYARRVALDRGPVWAARRLRNDAARRCLARLGQVRKALGAGA